MPTRPTVGHTAIGAACDDLWALASAGELLTFDHGHVVRPCTPAGRRCILIAAGRAIVLEDGAPAPALGPGDVHGALEILTNRPTAAAAVLTITRCQAISVGAAPLHDLFATSPGLRMALLRASSRRLRRLTSALGEPDEVTR